MTITQYILIGITYMFILDIIGNSRVEGVRKTEWTWGNRLSVVALWPIFVALFLYHLIKAKIQ